MNKKISSIIKGWGEDSHYFKVGAIGVTKIEEGLKSIEFDADGITKELLVYNVYKGDDLYCEIESNSSIEVYFMED